MYCFTVNLLDRNSDLLTDNINALRKSVRDARAHGAICRYSPSGFQRTGSDAKMSARVAEYCEQTDAWTSNVELFTCRSKASLSGEFNQFLADQTMLKHPPPSITEVAVAFRRPELSRGFTVDLGPRLFNAVVEDPSESVVQHFRSEARQRKRNRILESAKV
jgi:hypothetical protein